MLSVRSCWRMKKNGQRIIAFFFGFSMLSIGFDFCLFCGDTTVNQILFNKRICVRFNAAVGVHQFETRRKFASRDTYRHDGRFNSPPANSKKVRCSSAGWERFFITRFRSHSSRVNAHQHQHRERCAGVLLLRINIYLARILHHQIFKWINCKRWWFATDTIAHNIRPGIVYNAHVIQSCQSCSPNEIQMCCANSLWRIICSFTFSRYLCIVYRMQYHPKRSAR